MKTFLFAIALMLNAATISRAADDPILAIWRSLSTKTQNLHYALHSVPEGGAPDPSMHEEFLTGIDDALNQLVAADILVSKQIELAHPPTKDAKDWKTIFYVVHRISEEYGYYVASEMCDLGGRRVFQIFKPGDTINLHLRLPKKDLEDFLAASLPLVVQTNNNQQNKAEMATPRKPSD